MAAADEILQESYDVVVVGAGFSGLYMVHQAREELGLDVLGVEAGSGPGGTWYWNRYPGARCDSESFYYCYTFSKVLLDEWNWSSRYPEQPEILRYLEFASDRLDLRRSFSFDTRIDSAAWDDEATHWIVRTSTGRTLAATYLVAAVGCLSAASVPTSPASATSPATGTTPGGGRRRAWTSTVAASPRSALDPPASRRRR